VTAGIIVAGSSLSGGVGYRRLNLFNDIDIELEGNVSVRRYQDYRVAIGLLDSRPSTLELDVADRKVASLLQHHVTQVTRLSPLPRSAISRLPQSHLLRHRHRLERRGPRDYALHGLSVEGVWQWQLTPVVGVSARAGWLDLEVGTGRNDTILNLEDRFVPALVPGAPEQPLYFTYGAGVVHDTRLEPSAS
jgi:hypothetical protein